MILNSRLAVRIRQKEGLSYGVGSDFQASALDKAGTFIASAISAPQNHAKVQKAFQEELDKVLANGFSSDELAAAQSGYLQSEEVDRSDDGNLASQLAEHLFDGHTLQWDEQFDAGVKSLTPEQVGMAMKKYIIPNQLVIVGAGDFSKGVS